MKKKKGFTLVEIVAALASFMIVMLAITTLLISTIDYSGRNRKTYNSDNISKSFFEAMRESRPSIPIISGIKDVTVFEGKYKVGVDNENEVREFVLKYLFNKDSRPISLTGSTEPSNLDDCRENGKLYSIGIKVEWNTDGYYEVETWCWNNSEGNPSLSNRKTFIAPK